MNHLGSSTPSKAPDPARKLRHERAIRAAVSVCAVTCALTTGCAQIESRSTIEVVPRPELEPRWLGEAKTVVGRELDARWAQSQRTVRIRLHETRRCRAVVHQPVDRVETVDRTVKHGALYWEYGVGAAFLAVGIAALAAPEAFSNRAVDDSGNTTRDTATGLRLGGILTALGAGMVGVAAYDTVRSRDSVTTTRAYRVTAGDETPCPTPRQPISDVVVELTIGPWSHAVSTDDDGVARFELPDRTALGVRDPAPAVDPAQAGPSTDASLPDAESPLSLDTSADNTDASATEPPRPTPQNVTATIRVGERTGMFILTTPLVSTSAEEQPIELQLSGAPRAHVEHAAGSRHR